MLILCLLTLQTEDSDCFCLVLAFCASFRLLSIFLSALFVSIPLALCSKTPKFAQTMHLHICGVSMFMSPSLCAENKIANVTLCFHTSVYSSEESNRTNCNTTQFGDQNQVKVLQDCEQRRSDQCNNLQERFNALTRERDQLRNQISELNNVLRNLKPERN